MLLYNSKPSFTIWMSEGKTRWSWNWKRTVTSQQLKKTATENSHLAYVHFLYLKGIKNNLNTIRVHICLTALSYTWSVNSICSVWIPVEQSVASFDIAATGRWEPVECCSNQRNRNKSSYPNWKVNPPGNEPLVKLNWLPPGSAKNAWNTLFGSMSPGKNKCCMYSLLQHENLTPNYKVCVLELSLNTLITWKTTDHIQ